MSTVLDLQNISVRFGGLTAIKELSFVVDEGSIFSIIGPNGAGKTTLFNVVSGVYRPSAGCLLFKGKEIKRPFSLLSTLGVISLGLVISALLFLLINAQSLWEASIISNYIYLEPFPWRHAFESLLDFCLTLGFYDLYLPLIVGFIVGASAALTLWYRARYSTDHFTRSGIARTFQNIRIFRELTVGDNVRIALDRWYLRPTLLCAFLGNKFDPLARKADSEVSELLSFVGLENVKHRLARELSYGDQRRLEIARALATRPTLLLLDEPAAGMNPSETQKLMELIKEIRLRGITVVLIEHHMNLVMGISDRIVVLDYGVKIAEGTPAEVQANPVVVKAYLGSDGS